MPFLNLREGVKPTPLLQPHSRAEPTPPLMVQRSSFRLVSHSRIKPSPRSVTLHGRGPIPPLHFRSRRAKCPRLHLSFKRRPSSSPISPAGDRVHAFRPSLGRDKATPPLHLQAGGKPKLSPGRGEARASSSPAGANPLVVFRLRRRPSLRLYSIFRRGPCPHFSYISTKGLSPCLVCSSWRALSPRLLYSSR